jgi:hypothetical protein
MAAGFRGTGEKKGGSEDPPSNGRRRLAPGAGCLSPYFFMGPMYFLATTMLSMNMARLWDGVLVPP